MEGRAGLVPLWLRNMDRSTASATSPPLTDSRLAAVCAQTVLQAFNDYEARFHEITRNARQRFLSRDWPGSFADSAARLRLYTEVLNELTARIKTLLGGRLCERNVWSAIKAV